MPWTAAVIGAIVEPSTDVRRPSAGGSSPDVALFDLGQVDGVLGAELGVAVAAAAPDRADRVCELVVRGAAAHERAQAVAAKPEEACVETPLGRDPRARAVAAERLRDRGDDADLAAPVAVAPAPRHLAAVVRLRRFERQLGVD